MTVDKKALVAPVLQEAVMHDGKMRLYVHNLRDPARGEVLAYANHKAGDLITFRLETSTGNTLEFNYAVTESAVWPVQFEIKKSFFESEPIPGTSVELSYIITRIDSAREHSESLIVHLEQ